MSGLAKPTDMLLGTFKDEQLVRVLRGFGADEFTVLPFFALNEAILDLRRRTETARKVIVEIDGQVRFLKELPWYCSSIDFAAFESAVQDQLRSRGAPVPALLPAEDGRAYFHDRLSGSIFLLQEYVEGRSWTGSVAEAIAAGRALGTMHRVAAGLEARPTTHMQDVFGSARGLIGLLYDAWRGPGAGEVHGFAEAALQVVRECEDRARRKGYMSTRCPVHGDYNPFNLIFKEGGAEVVAIVDFDNSCIDHPAHDLGEALVRFGWMKYRGLSSSYGEVPEKFDPEQLRGLLQGYATTGGLSEHLLEMLPDVMTVVALELAAIGLLSSYYTIEDLPALRRNAAALPVLAYDAVSALQ